MHLDSEGSPAATQPGRIGTPALLAITAAGALLGGLAAVVALTGDMPHEVALAERQALIVATPIAVGLYAWRDGTHARFGRLLVLAGGAWFLAALASSSSELLYSVGRVSGWVLEAGLVYLILAFPSGRLTTRIDRWLAAAAVGLVAMLFLPTALIAETYPTPTPVATCDAECPGNAFMVLSSEPAFLDDVVVPLRELLTAAILLAVVIRLADRIRWATRLMRRTLVPVLVVAILRTLALPLGFGLRGFGADQSAVEASMWVIGLGLPALCIGFLIGLFRWRIHIADSLVHLARGLPGLEDHARRRDLIAATLSDPTVELAFWGPQAGDGWVDIDGKPAPLPPPPSDRRATLILDGDAPVGAVVHDAALSEQRPFVEAVGAYAFVWDDNRRLTARVESSLTELRESRARILAAADDERRRIERDLHDGGQQRLVALRIRLELADEMMSEDPAGARSMLHRLGGEVDAALDELRSLAAGVYPSLLAARGLYDALRTAALQSPLPASVDVDGSDRYSDEIETAAYFCCVEALQNVAKHAPDAGSVSIALSRNGDLRFEVRDDGPGFVVGHVAPGNGLMNMRDRMAAVGGELDIHSSPGAGTTVVGTIPVALPRASYTSATAGAASPDRALACGPGPPRPTPRSPAR
jgi:signal transduction histidine kinase